MNTPQLTTKVLQKIALRIQLGPTVDKETIARRTQFGYDLILDLPNNVHRFIIERLLETTDSQYIDLITLNLKQTCKFFYGVVNSLILEILESKYNPKAFFSNQFEILACPNSNLISDCLTTNRYKATMLFCFASAHQDIIACKAYVTIFNHHINNLLAHSEKSDFQFQFSQDTNKFSLLDVGNLATFSVNKYLFMRFLERYISNHRFASFANSGSDDNIAKWAAMIDFLKQNKSMDGIFDLVEQLIDKLSAPTFFFNDQNSIYYTLWNLKSLVDSQFIKENAFNHLLPKIVLCCHLDRHSELALIYLLDSLARENMNFLTHSSVQGFIEKVVTCSMYNEEDEIDIAMEAISLLAKLSIGELIDEEITQEYLKGIIIRLDINNIKIAGAILPALVLLSTTKFLDFHTLDKLIPTLLLFLELENQDNKSNAVSLIQTLAEKGFKDTLNAYILKECFLKILRNDNYSHYEQILDLTNKLLKARSLISSNPIMNEFKNIAINNLKNANEAIRAHAIELLSLVASQKEQNEIVNTLILQSILESYKQSPIISSNFNLPDLIEFFKNINSNTQELTANMIALINTKIGHPNNENL